MRDRASEMLVRSINAIVYMMRATGMIRTYRWDGALPVTAADASDFCSVPTCVLLSSSMVGSKAANGGQVKTGQRMWPGTQMFYPVVCILGKPNRSTELMTVGFVL